MTKKDLRGLVVLMKGDKSLVQTKKIRIYQREKLVDMMHFLIPLHYEQWDGSDEEHPDMSVFTVILQYLGADQTIHAETLVRKSDGQGGYDDYVDADENPTHMIYELPIDTSLTTQAGDITMKLNLQYIRYEGGTVSDNDESEAEEPTPVQYVLNTEDTKITILPVADYYSLVPDESLSVINQKIAELDARQREIEATAEVYDQSKADNIELFIDKYNQCIRLTSHGKPIGDEIDLNTLGDAISDWQEAGLIKVITDEDIDPEPGPSPSPSDEYANDIVLVVNERERAIYLTHNGRKIGTPIYLEDLGVAVSDADEQGLIRVVTDDTSESDD